MGSGSSKSDKINNHRGLTPPYKQRFVDSHRGKKKDPDKNKDGTLRVEDVDYNIKENTQAHHTNVYDITQLEETAVPQLVVRRGQSFDVTLIFNRPYDKNTADLRLVFEAGDKPLLSKRTHVEFRLSEAGIPKEWGAKLKTQDKNTLSITIFTPPTCYVAKWRFKVDVIKKKTDQRYTHKEPIYILFNPWSKDDLVYVEDKNSLKEYILNENGRIYSGTYNNISPKPWNFAQFQDDVLDCAMLLLDISGLKWTVRGNPVQVIRKLTSMVNSRDNDGVLVGKWFGDYSGGRSPLTWTGSQAILEEYYKTRMAVKFGQCWVFSGVLTTVCRALGIPARSVTNFVSAHDTDGSVSIDYYFDQNREPVGRNKLDSDSLWNFHVWNEVWMARPDLPAGYGGWQVADATPQETSDDVYCCGPVSLFAVKHGELGYAYDGPFIFAEVNADVIYWVAQKDGSMVNNHVDTKCVGQKISTKLPLCNEREDITHLYKFPEGTPEERSAVLRANQTGSCRHISYTYHSGPTDVQFELVPQDDIYVGQDFDVIFKIKNTSRDERSINGRIFVKSMFYTGRAGDPVATDTFDLFVQGGRALEHKLRVRANDYMSKLKDMCMLKFTAMAQVQDTKQIFAAQEDFKLCKPSLTMKVPNEIKKNKSFDMEVSFTNPLAESLTGCYLEVEGPGIQKRKHFPQRNIEPKQTFVSRVELTPKKVGDREILVMFNCKQLEDVTSTTTISVKN